MTLANMCAMIGIYASEIDASMPLLVKWCKMMPSSSTMAQRKWLTEMSSKWPPITHRSHASSGKWMHDQHQQLSEAGLLAFILCVRGHEWHVALVINACQYHHSSLSMQCYCRYVMILLACLLGQPYLYCLGHAMPVSFQQLLLQKACGRLETLIR